MGRNLRNRRKKIDEDLFLIAKLEINRSEDLFFFFFRDHHDFRRKIAKLESKSNCGSQELKSRYFGLRQKVFADSCFKARFHCERGKEHSLFVLLLFFALASILTARFKRSMKETRSALFHARSGKGPLEITRFLLWKLNFVYRSESLSYVGLESGSQYEKG